MSYRTVKTCEKSTKYIDVVDKNKMKEYCSRKPDVLDTLVQPYVPKTQSERFYVENWINVCEKNQDGLSIPCNLYDNMRSMSLRVSSNYKPNCYPTIRVDQSTGTLANELTDSELEKICRKRIIRSIDVPHDIFLMIDFGRELLNQGYTRVKYGQKEDFSIPENNLSSETLYLWKKWMEKYGPRSRKNYYFNYVKWVNSNVNDKKAYSKAVEWLLKGGDLAYLWLQSEDVINKIKEKYRDDKS